MVNIYLNDTVHQLDSECSVQDFILQHYADQLHCAVAIDNQLIPRGAYGDRLIKAGDRVDIIVPMQGG